MHSVALELQLGSVLALILGDTYAPRDLSR